MRPNDTQVGGDHYRTEYQHWDLATDLQLGYFEGQITKYVTRWRNKNGIQDLEKAKHFTAKLREGVLHRKLSFKAYDMLQTSLTLYRYNRANRLWMAEEDIVRMACTWSCDNDLQEIEIRIDRLIAGAKNRDASALRHERDPDSAAVKAKPAPGTDPAAPTPLPHELDTDAWAKAHPEQEYAVSQWYEAQCQRHGVRPLHWLSMSQVDRRRWRAAWGARNMPGVTDPHGNACADEDARIHRAEVHDVGVAEGHRNAAKTTASEDGPPRKSG